MASAPDAELEILAVTLVDMRATTDSIKRSIVHAQSSIEQYRHTQSRAMLKDIESCLIEIRDSYKFLPQAATDADEALRALLDRPPSSPPSSSTPSGPSA
jgi:phage-related protein